jgi:thiol-disulfide isomerase/thioredoxin
MDGSILFGNKVQLNLLHIFIVISMKKTILVDIISYFFIILFLYTGVAKLMEVNVFKEQLDSSPFLGSIAGIVTWALPVGEILLAIALFIPRIRLKALYATAALMTFFTIYVVVILFMDNHLSCSCGGIIEELSPKEHVLFNCACVVLSAVAIAAERRREPSTRFRWVASTSTLCLFLVVGWTLFTAFSAPATEKTGMEGRLLPSFDLLLADSVTHLNTADIPTGQPFIVIGFSPWCTHCQAETRDIIKNIEQFKHTHIYYVTNYPFSDMMAFYTHFKLAQYPIISMGREGKGIFFRDLKAGVVPYTAIFDSKKRLKQVIAGQADAGMLAKLAIE